MLDSERNADYGNAENGTDAHMKQSHLDSAEDYPDNVHSYIHTAGIIRSCLHFSSERTERQACDLHQLKSEWDTDDGNAVKNAKHEVTYADKDATEQHPKDIS
jgi:hypothetical protein